MIVVMAVGTLLAVGCRNNPSGNIAELCEFVGETLRADSSGYAAAYRTELDSITSAASIDKEALRKLISHYVRQSFYDGRKVEVINFTQKIIGILDNDGQLDQTEREILIGCYVCLGAALEEAGMPGMSLDCYTIGIEKAKDDGTERFRAMLLNNIGVLLTGCNVTDSAEAKYAEALEINRRLGIDDEIYINYNNIASVAREAGDVDHALDAALKSIQYIDAVDNPADFYSTHILLGGLYARRGNWEIAESYLENGLKHLREVNYVPGIIDGCNELSEYYLMVNQPDSAVCYATDALVAAQRARLQPLVRRSLENRAGALLAKGQYMEAAADLKHVLAITDSMAADERRMRLLQWNDINVATLAKNNAAPGYTTPLWWILGVVTAVGAAIYAVVAFRRMRAGFENRLQLAEARCSDIAGELALRNREMTMMSLEKIKNREGIETMCNNLKALLLELNPKSTVQRKAIRDIISKDINQLLDNSSDGFKESFERVNPEFYKVLKETYPNLTPREERLCAFLYMGLSTKEIASITNREIRSVESSRNRLRRKINIDNALDITEHLRSLTGH